MAGVLVTRGLTVAERKHLLAAHARLGGVVSCLLDQREDAFGRAVYPMAVVTEPFGLIIGFVEMLRGGCAEGLVSYCFRGSGLLRGKNSVARWGTPHEALAYADAWLSHRLRVGMRSTLGGTMGLT